ncbi:MAG: ABC transporter ATP-binding protein [Acetomicrobium sp.]|jgi:ABC-2 type transport system ATP-binding protein/fluoroquinolone transport system ATP-binding protein
MIQVENLTYRYGKGKEVLHGISFTVEKGEIFGFLGPNGSGKTTTQKILMGILKNYGGSVRVLGKEIKDWDETLYHEIGVLFEFPYLYTSLSAVDNLRYFSSFYAPERRRDIEALLDRLGLKKGFANKSVATFSKGMKQRTSMARALVNSPVLLFLDEPTSGLDPAGAVLIREIIREEKERGATVFLTTHNMYDADLLCDRVAFLSDGEIKVIDTPHNLKTQNGKKQVEIEYRIGQEIKTVRLDAKEAVRELPFPYTEIIRIHSVEPTLEEVFIRYTGRGLT